MACKHLVRFAQLRKVEEQIWTGRFGSITLRINRLAVGVQRKRSSAAPLDHMPAAQPSHGRSASASGRGS